MSDEPDENDQSRRTHDRHTAPYNNTHTVTTTVDIISTTESAPIY